MLITRASRACGANGSQIGLYLGSMGTMSRAILAVKAAIYPVYDGDSRAVDACFFPWTDDHDPISPRPFLNIPEM